MNYKKLLWKSLLVLLFFLPLACETQDDGDYVTPVSSYEKMNGTWTLSTLTQSDLIAETTNDIGSKLNFKSFVITFNADSTREYAPTSFKVEGNAPELFLKEGFWDIDNPFRPVGANLAKIRLYSDEAKTNLVDVLELVSVPGVKKEIEFKLTRYTGVTPYTSYSYVVKSSK